MLQCSPTAQPVLLVAVCTGQRCTALRRLAGDQTSDGPSGVSPSEAVLRRAVRERPDAVLVSVPCPGGCHQASWAAVGPGLAGPDATLRWSGAPTVLGLTETADTAQAVADWITSGAPDPRTLPDDLRPAR